MDITWLNALIGIVASLVAIAVGLTQLWKHREKPSPSTQTQATSTKPILPSKHQPIFQMTSVGTNAKARQVGGGFVVLKGSTVKKATAPSLGGVYVELRQQLVSQGKLVESDKDGYWVFTADVPFNSPSAAAAVVAGMNMPGPTTWQIPETGQTYKHWAEQPS